ncbi:uncharacterized protein LOC143264045 [Megachile rotundata]|uniref:uncharacterized protein LOC143264045 n=1 Tax=Megachile rotundata TaxID=143995 RepID=UPI003FD107C5
MKLTCTIYILISFFAKNKENFLVRCIAYFDKTELVHLSQNLNHFECLQLMKAMYKLMLRGLEGESNNYEVFYDALIHLSLTSKECLAELENWNNDFPGNTKLSRRSIMELTLKWLGRPDLAKYVKGNHNLTETMDTKDDHIVRTLKFPVHKVSKRHISKNDKHSSRSEKKKQKRDPHKHSQSVRKKKRPQKAAVKHSPAHKTHKLNQKEKQSQAKKDYIEQHRSISCSILAIIFFIIFCLVAVYFLQRRNRLKIRDISVL